MKNLFLFAALPAALTLMTACTPKSDASLITPQGVAPVLLGTIAADLPAQAEGLYEVIETIHVDGWYDEMDGVEVPGYDYLSFRLGDDEMLIAGFAEGGKTIGSISVKSPSLTYKGVGAGTLISEALNAGAKVYIAGCYESCGFYAKLMIDDIAFDFPFLNGRGFSEAGQQKLCSMDELSTWTEVDFTPADFAADAAIESISLQ